MSPLKAYAASAGIWILITLAWTWQSAPVQWNPIVVLMLGLGFLVGVTGSAVAFFTVDGSGSIGRLNGQFRLFGLVLMALAMICYFFVLNTS